MPRNMTPSSVAMMIIVCWAFFHSTGLNAGTPLATASVPVMAEQPSAKARASRKTPMFSVARPVSGVTSVTWRQRAGQRLGTTPRPISSSIEPMKM